jgi:hypothetical protein
VESGELGSDIEVLKLATTGLFFDDTGSGKNARNRAGRCGHSATCVPAINWMEILRPELDF